MSAVSTVLERQRSSNSLVCLLQGVERKRVTVELRDETAIEGLITSVDCYMNIEMGDVTLYPRYSGAAPQKFDSFFISGKHIRYVHLPDHIDVMGVLQKQVKALTKLRSKRHEKQTLR
uniref:Sm domain-containing protein n=1 Tax=Plectus sambesii TaxID=2011161 RepID=A0A914XDT2_9BILA